METLWAGVAAQQCTVGTDVVLEVLRHGIVDVAQRALGIELNWGTFANVQVEDLPKRPSDAQLARHFGSDGLDFEFVERRWAAGAPSSAVFTAESSVMRADWESNPDPDRYNPAIYVGEVRANYPTPVEWASQPISGFRVSVALSRWALYGRGQTLHWLAGALTSWAVNTAAAIDADCGFVALGNGSLKSEDSAWEAQQKLSPGLRDLRKFLWGFGWGTLLGPQHVTAVGGVEPLRTVAARVVELPGDRVWVDLGDDPAAVAPEQLVELEQVLDPVLRRQDSPRPA